jgi:polysaccharide deacetylase family protein (PEP-CTERM system associated)
MVCHARHENCADFAQRFPSGSGDSNLAYRARKLHRQDSAHVQWSGAPVSTAPSDAPRPLQVVLSFDVEEHFRIEAAARLEIDHSRKVHYRERLEISTRWILDQLDEHQAKATFFVVGQIARSHPDLVKAMARAGHEIASHSWEHRRIHSMTPAEFREDVRKSKDALEQLTGLPVLGFRAPTFSVVEKTAWALDVLAELGFAYDSSIFPVWHDRYGVPRAPRGPFRARGMKSEILELPLATWRTLWTNLPVGGGGYFRLLPLFFMELAIRQAQKNLHPALVMLYFHPWEFDPDQERLPLSSMNHLRTYVGLGRSRGRLGTLLARHRFVRAIDAAEAIGSQYELLPRFMVSREEAVEAISTGTASALAREY